jgi:hypothetical protein
MSAPFHAGELHDRAEEGGYLVVCNAFQVRGLDGAPIRVPQCRHGKSVLARRQPENQESVQPESALRELVLYGTVQAGILFYVEYHIMKFMVEAQTRDTLYGSGVHIYGYLSQV